MIAQPVPTLRVHDVESVPWTRIRYPTISQSFPIRAV